MNRKFAKVDEARKFTFAPNVVTANGHVYLSPSADHYAAADDGPWLPFRDERPVETGYTFAPLDTATERDGVLYRDYERTAETPRPIVVSKSKVEAVIDEMEKTAAFNAWLASKAVYFGAWMRGGDVIEYDPTANGGDLASLIGALGIPPERVPELIKQVEA